MSGMTLANGYGVMHYGAEYVVVRRDLLEDPTFDRLHALEQADVAKAELERDRSVDWYESEVLALAEEDRAIRTKSPLYNRVPSLRS